MPKVMVGIMIKDSAKWLKQCIDQLYALSFSMNDLRIVFEYGKSSDDTLNIAKDIEKEGKIKTDIFAEPCDPSLRQYGAQAAASVYHDFQFAINPEEDYFLLMDSDVIKIPPTLIDELIKVNADIVAPYPWSENKSHFYDNWIFRINNQRFSPFDPPGNGLNYPIYVDSVGTCFLAKRGAWINVPISNPYPNLTFCNNARVFGFDVVACPYLEITHLDVAKLGFVHNPLHPSMGGYPATESFIDSKFVVNKYEK